MAIFRKIHVNFWSDSFISSCDDKVKLFYLYLLTNERTSQLGVYEITKKQIAFDLGYSIDTVSILINEVEKLGKIRYNPRTCEMALKNWNKYNGNESKKVKVLTDRESSNIKDKSLIEYLYSIDTVLILNPQEEEEREEEKEEEQAPATEGKIDGDGIISKNLKTATNFKELPDHIRELCENLIKNNFRFSKVTDEILELGIITFHNEEEYLKRRGFTTRIPDVFYYAPNGYKYHSLLDILFFLMSDDVSKNQIKMTTGLQDDKLITDWVLTYAKHVFTENKGLIISEMRNHIKRCWTSKPGIDFQAKLYAPKYNQLPKNENQR